MFSVLTRFYDLSIFVDGSTRMSKLTGLFMDESPDPLQAEILSRLNSLEDRIIEIAKQINVIEGMGAIEKSREKIERTKQEILNQLMEKANAKNRDAS